MAPKTTLGLASVSVLAVSVLYPIVWAGSGGVKGGGLVDGDVIAATGAEISSSAYSDNPLDVQIISGDTVDRDNGLTKELLPPVALPSHEGLMIAASVHCVSVSEARYSRKDKGVMLNFTVVNWNNGNGLQSEDQKFTVLDGESILVELAPRAHSQLVSVHALNDGPERCRISYTYSITDIDGGTLDVVGSNIADIDAAF